MEKLDLTDVDSFTYSAFLRKLRKKTEPKEFLAFLKIYKKNFDRNLSKEIENLEKVSLTQSLIQFNKLVRPLKIDKEIIKNAAIAELGTPELVGAYLSGIIKFILKRISVENRDKSINNLKNKFQDLDVFTIANKKMPASSSLGQSITFVKHVLFGHDARYIKLVLDSIIKNL